jgi:hypothetical protein
MINSIREELESTVTPLLREIFDDARKLMHQEARLVRAEVREESIRMRNAVALVALGIALSAVSILMLGFMLAYLVGAEWFNAPLWVGFGFVALVGALGGAGFLYSGFRRLKLIRDSSEQAMRALRGGFGWMQGTM